MHVSVFADNIRSIVASILSTSLPLVRRIDDELNGSVALDDLFLELTDAAVFIVHAQAHMADVPAVDVGEVETECAVARELIESPGFTESRFPLATHDARARRRVGKDIRADLLGVEVSQVAGVLDGLPGVLKQRDVLETDGLTDRRALREQRELLGHVNLDG